MLNKLFHKKKEYSRMNERIVWGLWTTRRLQFIYKVFATELRVPISVLATYILTQWLSQNYETLLNDKEKKNEFAELLVKKYLNKGDS